MQTTLHTPPQKSESPAATGRYANRNANSLDSATENAIFMGAFPSQKNTVIAEVLCQLLNGNHLTCMDAVFNASTTRLSASVWSLENSHGWSIERRDIDVGTKDGRVAVVTAYFLNRATIRKAFDAGALQFCRGVKAARAALRKEASSAKKEADKSNARRALARFDPNQRPLFGV